MKWIFTSKPKAALQEYQLIDNDTCKVVLKYNPRHQSARISCGAHQRLFFIESAGQLTPKTLFKNEYGMEIGNLSYDNKWSSQGGTITIDSKKYHYRLHNNPLAELVIYENNLLHPLVSCGIKTEDSNTRLSFADNMQNSIDNSCLLLGLCWYLFLPIAKENLVAYAL